MPKRCTKCGVFLTEEDRFCPNCGENAPQSIPAEPQFTQSSYTSAPAPYPTPGNTGALPPPVTPASYRPVPIADELTLGKWVLTLIVTNFLGVISWIFLFIWGFGGAGPESRKNYCRAMLIVRAIGTVLAVLLAIFYMTALFAGLEGYADYNGYGDYTRAAAAILPRFLS
ncbi:MAG: hypothetical protein NC084_01660 [Bacteroides sp.]|nr:hypothetical protein [Eubacterium sp.]MCM1419251.1 hypothetical protein [Roseburia sp.]MCM1461400.1 hypothetical protein [Bacteroides sp.]